MNRVPKLITKDYHGGQGYIHWNGYIDVDQLYTQPTVKITGSEDSYMYLIQVDMLEKIMRNYIQNPYVKDAEISDWNATDRFTGLIYFQDFRND